MGEEGNWDKEWVGTKRTEGSGRTEIPREEGAGRERRGNERRFHRAY